MSQNADGLPSTPRERRHGAFEITSGGTIWVGDALHKAAPGLARSLQERLCSGLGMKLASPEDAQPAISTPAVLIGLAQDHPLLQQLVDELPFDVRQAMADEGFVLDVSPDRVLLVACTPHGAFYGAMAVLEQSDGAARTFATGRIADWPVLRRPGMHLLVKSRADMPGLEAILTEHMPRLRLNALILEINYSFQFRSHPEVTEGDALTREDCRHLKTLADRVGVRLIPMLNCLGHQSWAEHTAQLLNSHPEFDETPGPQMDPGFYCRSWCPSHPDINSFVCELIDELLEAFDADAFHAGMDEVFVLGQCPRCKGEDNAALFARSVNDLHAHLVGHRQIEMLIWGDRLLDAAATDYGLWEASGNGTAPAIDLIPKDIVICDWHYETRYAGQPASYPSVSYFQEKGFHVWPSGWNSAENAQKFIGQAVKNSGDRMDGYLATTWVGVGPVAGGLSGDPEQLAKKNVPGVIDAVRTGARLAWAGE